MKSNQLEKDTKKASQSRPKNGPIKIFAGMIVTLLRPSRSDLLARYTKQTLLMLGAKVYWKVLSVTTVVVCDQQLIDSCHPEFLFALRQGFTVVTYEWFYNSLYHKQRERFGEYAVDTESIRDKLSEHHGQWQQMKQDSLAELGSDQFKLLRDPHDLFQFDIELVRLDRKRMLAEKVELRIWESFAPHQGGPAREYRVICKHKIGAAVLEGHETQVYGHSSDALAHFKGYFERYVGYAWDERHEVEQDWEWDDNLGKGQGGGKFKYVNEEHLP